MLLKLEKVSAPAKFPTGVFSTGSACFLTSIDKPGSWANKGDFVVFVSTDLEQWSSVLRHATECHPVVAFGGLVLHKGAGETVWFDGAGWVRLEFPGTFFTSDGADGLWSIGASLARRRATESTFEPVPTEVLPNAIIACEALTLVARDGGWYRLRDDGACEPVPTLRRRRVQRLLGVERVIYAIVDEALWRSTDGGRSFSVCELKYPALSLGTADGRLVVGARGALVTTLDGHTFTTISENPEAAFSTIVSVSSGALVIDARRQRLFGLAEKGQRPSLALVERDTRAVEHPELTTVLQRFAELEAPLLARRSSPLEHARTQAERLPPTQGSQPHLVYLDALQDAGDREAPHLAMLNRLQRGPRFDQYLAEHRALLLDASLQHAVSDWKDGFLRRASLHVSHLPALFSHTSAHLLRELSVWSRDDSTADLSVLAQTLRGLHHLSIDGIEFDDEGPMVVCWGDLGALWPALGQLESLSLSGAVTRFGPLIFPKLVSLSLLLDDSTALNELKELLAPRLTELRLGALGDGPWLVDLLGRDVWPRLRSVHLGGPAVATLLARVSPGAWPSSLDALTMPGCQLTDASVEQLAASLTRRLSLLDVRSNRLTSAGIARALGLADRVLTDHQQLLAEFHWPPGWYGG